MTIEPRTNGQPVIATFSGKRVELRAVRAEDTATIDRWLMLGDSSFWFVEPWLYYSWPQYTQRVINSRAQSICHLIDGHDQGPVGLIRTRLLDLRSKHATVDAYVAAEYREAGFGFEALCVLRDYLFTSFDFNKIFVEVPAGQDFVDAADHTDMFHLEMSFRDHFIFRGTPIDLHVYSVRES